MGAIVFLLIAFQIYGSLSKAIDEPENYMALRAVAGDINKFSTQFYETISEREDGNFVSSPLSVSMVLSMISYGAQGNTASELKSALYLNRDEDVEKRGLKTLLENLNDFSKVELKLANKIFLAENITIKSEFKDITETVFNSSTENVDYNKPEEASKFINEWCEKQTNSKIKDLVLADDLSNDTSLVLVNAVYFKGNWATQFNASETTPKPFHLADGTTKDVPTMHHSGEFRYGVLADLGAKFVELPYESNDISDAISMFIILPDEVSGLKHLEANLSTTDLSHLFAGEIADVDLYLPKFKIESKIDLKDTLTTMGLKDMFEDTADFSGIIDSQPLKVSKIVQKAFIEVNEEGSEAAAATGIQFTTFSFHIPIEFRVNRPFYYAIVKRLDGQKGGVILFHGHYKSVD